MYNFSKYCIFNYTPKGELIIFNTLNGKLVKFNETKNRIESLKNLDSFEVQDNDLLHVYLKDNLFIVPCGYDEFTRAQKYCKMFLKNSQLLSVIIMPTLNCNFRCTYCYEEHENKSLTENITNRIVDYFNKNIDMFESIEIQWFGGEPLLKFEDILHISSIVKKQCIDKKKNFRASITTNGYLLDPDKIEKLFNECNIRLFQITLDGVKETHNMQRPLKNNRDSYDAVLSGLLALKETNYDFNVIVRTNVTKKMLEYDMEYFFKKMLDCFGDDRRFSFMIRKAFGLPEQDTATPNDMKKLYNIIYKVGLKMTADYRLSYGGRGICYAAKPNHYCIGPDGNVYKCSVQFDNFNNQIGNVMHDGFDKSEKLDYWEKSTDRLISGKEICKNCVYYPICAGVSCPANISFNLTDNTCSIYNNLKTTNEQILIYSNDDSICIDWDKREKIYD